MAFRSSCASLTRHSTGPAPQRCFFAWQWRRRQRDGGRPQPLDCGVFLHRGEFRKSSELAWNKSKVRIQDMDHHARFIADLSKRFVVDDEVGCRVNYGFTSKHRFAIFMKIPELNFENIPVIVPTDANVVISSREE